MNDFKINDKVMVTKGKYKGQSGVIMAYVDMENTNYCIEYVVHIFDHNAEIINYNHLEKQAT